MSDALEIRAPAAVQSPLEGLIRIQIHQSDSVLENVLGIGAGLVWVTFLIPIGRVERNGDKGFFGRGVDADGEGLFHPVIDRTFPFAEAKEAYRHFEGRRHFGKVVITHG